MIFFRPGRHLVLVLCGGIGHSTELLYRAVAQHPVYREIAIEIQGKPEAYTLQMIAEKWYGLQVQPSPTDFVPGQSNSGKPQEGLQILVEGRSTNCGANALESRKVLESHGIRSPRSIILVQDPTMSRRTAASFEKAYAGTVDHPPQVICWPTFTPTVSVSTKGENSADLSSALEYSDTTLQKGDGRLWDLNRFLDLLMGEIPRLRDDENGYGPEGKGFIVHVDVPEELEEAWMRLRAVFGTAERAW